MKCILRNRALVSISGADAEEFLQNQFSNDISKLNHSHIQIMPIVSTKEKSSSYFG